MKFYPSLDKRDTKIYIKESKKKSYSFFISSIKCLFMGNIKGFRKNYNRSKSLMTNLKKTDYPYGLVKNKKKIAVYTVLYGDYDSIKPVKTKNVLCDYYIFTDQQVPVNSGWEKMDFEFPKEIKNNNILKNRYLKMHPHILFPEYEYSIYLDAVFTIELDIYRLMGRMGEHIIGLFDHHRGTQCLYEEAKILKRINKVPSADIDKQMIKYEKEGFPHNFGFVECGLIIRKHNDKKCIIIMETWWDQFIKGAKRDQLSFMYSIWKNGLTKKDIAYLGTTYWDEPIVPSEGHKK